MDRTSRRLDRHHQRAQGWCVDPFRLHEARWFSNGTPTALVRDAGVETKDPPPQSLSIGPFELAPLAEDDLAPVRPGSDRPSQAANIDAIWRVFVSTGGD